MTLFGFVGVHWGFLTDCRFHLSSSDSICVSIVQCFVHIFEVWWLEYRCLKACSVNPIYSFFSCSLVTTALYTIGFPWHLPFIGQLDITWQLHLQSWGVDASTVLLWLLIILATFGIQLLLTLIAKICASIFGPGLNPIYQVHIMLCSV